MTHTNATTTTQRTLRAPSIKNGKHSFLKLANVEDCATLIAEMSARPTTAEQKLLCAIIYRAALDYLSADQQQSSCAERWFESNERAPFSSAWTFEHLDLCRFAFYRQLFFAKRDKKHALFPKLILSKS